MKKLIPVTLAVASANFATALPIDWHGEFQVDTNRIEEFRRIESTDDNSAANAGTQEVAVGSGQKSNASFQSYIFKLMPEIIVNDSTTLKAVLTSGYGNGGVWGDSSQKKKVPTTAGTEFANALYSHNTVSDNSINLTQAYATFYSDAATYQLGRFATNWGLGAIHNDGSELGSHHATIRDGLKVNFKIGNFMISPYTAKISSGDSLTKSTRIKESGISLLYNNLDQEMSFGILYAKNKASNFANLSEDIDGDNTAKVNLGKTDVKITDLYFKKSFGKFSTEIEVPIMSGELGKLYSATGNANYKAKAILVHSTYAHNSNHIFNFNVGKVSGDAGNQDSYEALFLNPNFQIANVLFRYNTAAVSDTNQNIYDSYVTNTFYLKFAHTYEAGKWNWTNSVIWAKAEEVAKAGENGYNHQTNKTFAATFNQEDDLGIEIDSDFTYKWNTSVTLGGSFGYLMTGDYYAYTNTAAKNTVKDSYVLKAFANVKF